MKNGMIKKIFNYFFTITFFLFFTEILFGPQEQQFQIGKTQQNRLDRQYARISNLQKEMTNNSPPRELTTLEKRAMRRGGAAPMFRIVQAMHEQEENNDVELVDTDIFSDLQAEIDDTKTSQQQCNQELQQLKKEQKNIEAHLTAAKLNLQKNLATEKSLQNKISQNTKTIQELKNQLDAEKRNLQNIENSLQETEQKEQELQAQANSLNTEETSLNDEKNKLSQEQAPEGITVGDAPQPPTEPNSPEEPLTPPAPIKKIPFTEDPPTLDTSKIRLDISEPEGLEEYEPLDFDETPYAQVPFEEEEPTWDEQHDALQKINEKEIKMAPTPPSLSNEGEEPVILNLSRLPDAKKIKLEFEQSPDLSLNPIPKLLKILSNKLTEHQKIQKTLAALKWENFSEIENSGTKTFTAGASFNKIHDPALYNNLVHKWEETDALKYKFNLLTTIDAAIKYFSDKNSPNYLRLKPSEKTEIQKDESFIKKTRYLAIEFINHLDGSQFTAFFNSVNAITISGKVIKKSYETLKQKQQLKLFEELLKNIVLSFKKKIKEGGSTATYSVKLDLKDILQENLEHVLDVLAQMAIKNSQKNPSQDLVNLFNATETRFLDNNTQNSNNAHRNYFETCDKDLALDFQPKESWTNLTKEDNKFEGKFLSIKSIIDLIKEKLTKKLKFLDETKSNPTLLELLELVKEKYSESQHELIELLELMTNVENNILKQIEIVVSQTGATEIEKKFRTTFGMLENEFLEKIKNISEKIENEWNSEAESIKQAKNTTEISWLEGINSKKEQIKAVFTKIKEKIKAAQKAEDSKEKKKDDNNNEQNPKQEHEKNIKDIDYREIEKRLVKPCDLTMDENKFLSPSSKKELEKLCNDNKQALDDILTKIKQFEENSKKLSAAKKANQEKYETEMTEYQTSKEKYDKEQQKINADAVKKTEELKNTQGDTMFAFHKAFLDHLKKKSDNELENKNREKAKQDSIVAHEKAEKERKQDIERQNNDKKLAAQTAAQKKYDEEIAEAKRQHKIAQQGYNERKQQNEKQNQKITEQNEQNMKAFVEKLNKLRKEQVKNQRLFKEQFLKYQADLQKYNTLAQQAKDKNQDRKIWQEQHDQKVAALDAKLADLNIRKTTNQRAIEKNTAAKVDLAQQKEVVEEKITTIKTQIKSIEKETKDLSEKLATIQAQNIEIQAQIEILSTNQAKNQSLIEQKKAELSAIAEKINDLGNQLAQKQQEGRQNRAKIENVRTQKPTKPSNAKTSSNPIIAYETIEEEDILSEQSQAVQLDDKTLKKIEAYQKIINNFMQELTGLSSNSEKDRQKEKNLRAAIVKIENEIKELKKGESY